MDQEEINAVSNVLKSGWIGLGPKTREFEKALGKYLGVHGVIGLNSCTAALDMALRLIGINHGDEVLVPTITFVSTAHAVVYNHATPIFVDVDPVTLNIDFKDLERKITNRTKAVIPVHYSGRMVDSQKLGEILDEGRRKSPALGVSPSIHIIEDCAHAMGSYLVKDRKVGPPGASPKHILHAGSCCSFGCFSFHAVKNLAMGDGGALVHPWLDSGDIERAQRLRWLGIDKGTWDRSDYSRSYWWEYHCDEIGYKNHMNDIAAAIGLEQLKKLDKHNGRRKEIAILYTKFLGSIDMIETPQADTDESQSSWHIYHIKVPVSIRDDLSAFLKKRGIDTGVHYKPIHLYKCYGNTPYLKNAEAVWPRLLSLPMHPRLTNENIIRVCEEIKRFFQEKGLL